MQLRGLSPLFSPTGAARPSATGQMHQEMLHYTQETHRPHAATVSLCEATRQARVPRNATSWAYENLSVLHCTAPSGRADLRFLTLTFAKAVCTFGKREQRRRTSGVSAVPIMIGHSITHMTGRFARSKSYKSLGLSISRLGTDCRVVSRSECATRDK